MKATINQKNNSVTFLVDIGIYSKDVIYKACYVFIDKMYILLELSDKKNIIVVTLRGKNTLTKNNIAKLEGEFGNELLNCLVRENVSRRNQKVLEQIVGGAMGAALGMSEVNVESKKDEDLEDENSINEEGEIEAAIATLRKELEAIETEDSYEEDALGIREIALNVVNAKPAKIATGGGKNKQSKKKNNVRKK